MKLSRRRWVVGVLVVIVVVGAGWLFFGHNNEPRYEGKPVSYWLKEYYSPQHDTEPDSNSHEDAIKALRAMGSNALPYLVNIAFSTNQDSPSRTNLYNLLAKLPDSWNLPKLITEDDIRDRAFDAMNEIGVSARDILPLIQTELNQTNTSQRRKAIFMLSCVNNDVELAVPFLAKALHDPDSDVQNMAVAELGAIGPRASPALPDLMGVLENSGPGDRIRWRVAFTVELIGSNAAPAVPQLREAFNRETDWMTRGCLASCLYRINPSQTYALDYLIGVLTNNATPGQISFGASQLREIGPRAKPAIPTLLSVLETTNSTDTTSDDVLRALDHLGASNTQVMAALEQKMALDSDDARDYAANRILDLDSTNQEAELVLIDLVRTKSEFAWKEIERLGKMGPAAKEALPVLREALNSTNTITRVNAKFAIRAIEAKEAGK